MRPLMYSETCARLLTLGWHRVGEDIHYYKSNRSSEMVHLGSSEIALSITSEPQDVELDTYSLTWTIQFPFSNDVVYFAACYPYTYTQLRLFLNDIDSDPQRRKCCQQEVLCHSLAGNTLPLLTITEQSVGLICSANSATMMKLPEKSHPHNNFKKRCIIITGRVHPGETQSSWMMQGIIEFLTSNEPEAVVLRNSLVFKIVPMLNPDGVIVGNYRCSLTGRDPNRNYNTKCRELFPETWHVELMASDAIRNFDVITYCDLHGHSRKQRIFVYGCENAQWKSRPVERVLPAMLSKNAPDLFDYSGCRYVVQKNRSGTGRITMWRKGIANSYTLEATFCGTDHDSIGESYHFNTKDYKEMGRQFCETLLDYCDPENTK